MTHRFLFPAAFLLLGLGGSLSAQPKPMSIYAIDTEGGHSTLFVSPTGESMLMDAGFARDAPRILGLLESLGIKQIDYMLISHYHGDHTGNLAEITAKVPVKNYVDHGAPVRETDPFAKVYAPLYAKANRIIVKPGDKIPIKGFDALVLTSAKKVITKPLPGAGKPNALCSGFTHREDVDDENPQSVGVLLTYGKFRTIDLGDFLWDLEKDLMCPNNPIGTIDVYLASHHASERSGSPLLVHALHPLVAIVSNGHNKGGDILPYKVMYDSPGLQDIWATHWSSYAGAELNPAAQFIANMPPTAAMADALLHPPAARPPATDPAAGRGGGGAAGAGGARGGGGGGGAAPAVAPDHSPAYYIKVTAEASGKFTVTNSRNNYSRTYQGGTR